MHLTILFDIDGTLVHCGGAGWRAMHLGLQHEFGKRFSKSLEIHGRTDRGIVGEVFGHLGIENTAENRARLFSRYLSYLPDSLLETDGHLLPGVIDLLNKLRETGGIRIGLLTGNIEAAAWKKLDHFGLSSFFGFGGFGDQFSCRNLVAEQARDNARELANDHFCESRTIVIGDTPRDVECARWINCLSVGVLTGGGSAMQMEYANPDLLLKDLSDTEQVFQQMFGLCNSSHPI